MCEKAFTNAGHLKKHKIIHTCEKQFKYTECDEGFARSADLTRHMRKVFIIKLTDLTRHMRKVFIIKLKPYEVPRLRY